MLGLIFSYPAETEHICRVEKRIITRLEKPQKKRAVACVFLVVLLATSDNLIIFFFVLISIVGDVMPSFLGGTKRGSSADVAGSISPGSSGSSIAGDIATNSTHPPKSALKQYVFACVRNSQS